MTVYLKAFALAVAAFCAALAVPTPAIPLVLVVVFIAGAWLIEAGEL